MAVRSLTIVNGFGVARDWSSGFQLISTDLGAPSEDSWGRNELAVADVSANSLLVDLDWFWNLAPGKNPSVKETNWIMEHIKA